ncbi:MAG TPA: sulfurtransferase TusA family protein [Paracoccaceae bacterium]|nr:sulfurtransferase TusA family protein [Paracoccaceae bacterium]
MDPVTEIDARGLLCPLPVLRLRKHLLAARPGALFALLADDPAAILDVPHFCAEQGHDFLGASEAGGATRYLVRTSGACPGREARVRGGEPSEDAP